MIPVMLDDDVEIPGAKNLPAPVGVRVWRHGGKLHVVAVNSSREKVSCQLDLGAGLSRRSLALDLAPIETRFFELPQNSAKSADTRSGNCGDGPSRP